MNLAGQFNFASEAEDTSFNNFKEVAVKSIKLMKRSLKGLNNISWKLLQRIFVLMECKENTAIVLKLYEVTRDLSNELDRTSVLIKTERNAYWAYIEVLT